MPICRLWGARGSSLETRFEASAAQLDRPRAGLVLIAVRVSALVVVNASILHDWFGVGQPSCDSAQIATPVAREGTCARGQSVFGGGTTYTVVDARHVLHMPGYDTELLATRVAPTIVSDPQVNPAAFPNGQGMLVSFEIAITSRLTRSCSMPMDATSTSSSTTPRTRAARPSRGQNCPTLSASRCHPSPTRARSNLRAPPPAGSAS
jgi:hypothetical protein